MLSALFSSLIAIIFLVLTTRIIKIRKNTKISIGDANNPLLQRAIRAQSNFCETCPIALILMFIAESNGAASWLICFCAITLILGRISHAYGISFVNENFGFRIGGMILTFASILTLAVVNLTLFFFF